MPLLKKYSKRCAQVNEPSNYHEDFGTNCIDAINNTKCIKTKKLIYSNL